ncbi:hypothetical protein BKA70DRAFT_1558605 [Coprinopsis sp. MPI-PUGE-AT-0042]|nr:hypothetical protein BKA70DRAFT_1558605 [Coprinopsis sp. MPI-PUGE-AT-0042]
MAPAPPTATASTRRHRSRGSTPGRKSSKPKQSASNGNGLLSGVFSFVTQELSNFVAGATGRDEYEDEDVEHSGSPSQSSSSENEAETPTQSQASSRRKRSPSPRSPAHRPKRPRSSSKESKTKEHTRAAQAELDPYPTPRPILKAALDETASGSTSMPGALFPFSPASIFNDDGSDDESAPRSTRRRVHFDGKSDAGSSSHLVPISNVIEDEERDEDSAGPSTPHKKRTRRLSPSTPTRTPRTPPSSTIQAAVSKFRDADADASILLPSPIHGQLCPSPVRRHTPTMSEKAKGKQAARITSQVEPDPFDFEQDLSSGTTPSKTTGRERFTEDYLSGVSPEESFTTTHLKEQISQTTAAIERTSSSHSGSDVDKNRIRELEQEVQRLREELARRPSTINAPPPPPPPPPPNGLRIPLPSSLDPSTDASTLFLSARAALKHSGTPKEKPIISRPGLGPAVGIGPLGPSGGLGPDKMAAFLSEMKNVRLRKVGEKSFMNSERSFVSEGDVTRKEDANTSLSRSLLSKSWSGRAEGSRNQVRAGKPAAQETSNRLPDNTTAGDTNRMQDVGSKRKRSIEDVDQGRTEVDAISSQGATTLDPSTSMDTDNADLSFLSAPSLSVSTSRRHREQREQRRQREREQEARDREGAQTQLPSRGLSASIDSTVSASSSLLASRFGSDSTSSRLAVSTTPASAPPRRIVRDSNGIIRDWRTSTQAVPARVSPNEGSAAAHEEQQGRDLRTLHLEDLQAPTPSLCSDQDGDSHESHEDANQPRTPPQISPTSDSTSVARPFSGSGQLGGNGDDDHHGDLRLEFPDESRRYGAAIEESLLNEESFTYQVKLRVDSD